MRRLTVVVALLLLMVGVKALQAGDAGARDPLTLAAIGFVLLAAFTIAELGALLGLPRVTGYIVGGAILGPSISNILSVRVVGEMRMFNTLALGLIATSAGLELDFRQIAKVGRTLATTVLLKGLALAALVGGGLIGLQALLGSLDLAAAEHVYPMALVFATLGIGTSPAITLALLNEAKARGRPADLFLGAAVVKDLVVVVALAVAVAVSRSLLGGEAHGPGHGQEHGVAEALLRELGGSVAAGALLGGLLVVYLRFIKAEMLLFVAGMILVVSELGRALHLELLLVFITAGAVVRNFSKHEHDLMTPVEFVALPVFVVFFTIAGAGIDLETTLSLLPMALGLCGLRAVAFFGAARLAGQVGGESPEITRYAWLGYIPQAGVTLGLVGLAASQLPAIAAAISGLGMAVVAINLLVGPLTLRVALTKMGASSGPAAAPLAPPEEAAESGQPEVELAERAEPPRKPLGVWVTAAREQSPQLEAAVERLYGSGFTTAARFQNDVLGDIERQVRPALSRVVSGDRSAAGLVRAEAQLEAIQWSSVEHVAAASRDAFRELRSVLRRLPSDVAIEFRKEQTRIARGDELRVVFAKRLRQVQALVSKRARRRHVSLRSAGRVALERRYAAWAQLQAEAYARLRMSLVDTLRAYLRHHLTHAEAREHLGRKLDLWRSRAEADLTRAVEGGLDELLGLLEHAGLPGVDRGLLRLSRYEGQIQRNLQALDDEAADWKRVVADFEHSLQTEFAIARARATFVDDLERTMAEPAKAVVAELDGWLAALAGDLRACESALEAGDLAALPSPQTWARPAFPQALQSFEERSVQLRSPATLQRLSLELRASIDRLPGHLEVALTADDGHLVQLEQVRFRSLEPRRLATSRLVERMLPELETSIIELTAEWAPHLASIRETEVVVQHGLEQKERAVLSRAREIVSRVRSELPPAEQVAKRLVEVASQGFEGTAKALTRSAVDGVAAAPRHVGLLLQALEGPVRSVRRRGRAGVELLWQGGEWLSRWAGKAALLDEAMPAAADAASLSVLTGAWFDKPELPPSYARLLSLEAVREPRLHTARKALLEQLIAAEKRWLAGGPSSALLVGAHGSGRTSLLNVCQLELSASRVLRPEGLERRRGGLLAALALELRCSADPARLRTALRQRKTTILIDDLEEWLSPTLVGLEQLERLLQLITETRSRVFWIAAVASEAHGLLSELEPLQHAFSTRLGLGPLTGSELRRAIEDRHRLSGLPLEYRSPLGIKWLRRLGPGSEASLYFNVLARAAAGNLARALRIFAGSVSVESARAVVLTERALALKVPSLQRLGALELAALSELLRFGPSDAPSLATRLNIGSGEAERLVAFLCAAGLVQTKASHSGGRLSVPPRLRPIVAHECERIGVLSARRVS